MAIAAFHEELYTCWITPCPELSIQVASCRMQNAIANAVRQTKITRLSRVLSGVLVAFFCFLAIFPSAKEYLTLVPGRTLPCIWNLVTAGFATGSLFEVFCSVGALLLLARIVEPIYGSHEFLKFLLIVDFAACCATFVTVIIIFAASSAFFAGLLYAHFYGFHGVVAGLLVAVKQLQPDHEVSLAGGFKLRAKHVPGLFVLLMTATSLMFGSTLSLPFLWYGAYSAWLYLRFFQPQPETGTKGDPSTEFAFASFFPELLQPPVDRVAAIASGVFRLRHAEGGNGGSVAAGARLPRTAVPAATAAAASRPAGATLLGTEDADASRRRERGAKALEERLQGKKQQQQQQPLVPGGAGAVDAHTTVAIKL